MASAPGSNPPTHPVSPTPQQQELPQTQGSPQHVTVVAKAVDAVAASALAQAAQGAVSAKVGLSSHVESPSPILFDAQTPIKKFVMVRVAKSGNRYIVDLKDKQGEADQIWTRLEPAIINRVRERSDCPQWLQNLTDEQLEVTVEWKGGSITITNKNKPDEFFQSVLESDEKNPENDPVTKDFLAIGDMLRARKEILDKKELGVHTKGLVGASLKHGVSSFGAEVKKPDKDEMLEKLKKKFPQHAAKFAALEKVVKDFQEAKETEIKKIEEDLKPEKVKNLSPKDCQDKQKKLETLKEQMKYLEEIDKLALALAIVKEDLFYQEKETSGVYLKARGEVAKAYIESKAKEMAALIGIDFSKHWYSKFTDYDRLSFLGKRPSYKDYFTHIALLGISDTALHKEVCMQLGVEEPETNMTYGLAHYIRAMQLNKKKESDASLNTQYQKEMDRSILAKAFFETRIGIEDADFDRILSDFSIACGQW